MSWSATGFKERAMREQLIAYGSKLNRTENLVAFVIACFEVRQDLMREPCDNTSKYLSIAPQSLRKT